jgi:uncharacterized protein YijF (DUF1287 family)
MRNHIFWSLIVSGVCAPACADTENFYLRLVLAAREQTFKPVTYDGSYVRIAYPNGDVPAEKGVCTDVLIRAYRKVGIDLQLKVHEDMKTAFAAYPRIWGMSGPDTSIDHRRVPNLQTFFSRKGMTLAISKAPDDYRAGDIVSWMLPGNRPHIGIVTQEKSANSGRPLIIHNIGRGPELEDMLFDFELTGHYRYPVQ